MQLERIPLDEDWRYLDVFVSSSFAASLSLKPPAGLTLHSGITMPCTGAACVLAGLVLRAGTAEGRGAVRARRQHQGGRPRWRWGGG